MPNRFEKAAADAAQKTNGELRDELSRLTPLTNAEISRILPEKEDKEKLARLLAIVSGASSENQKVAALEKNIQAFGPVVVRVLRLLMV
ncbi:MAG TPA: hypothetical protein VNA89_02585 [Gemmatimonadaceae bacterium]|nr:hypothetical protein [Gemmatimonadaceae bacterium]